MNSPSWKFVIAECILSALIGAVKDRYTFFCQWTTRGSILPVQIIKKCYSKENTMASQDAAALCSCCHFRLAALQGGWLALPLRGEHSLTSCMVSVWAVPRVLAAVCVKCTCSPRQKKPLGTFGLSFALFKISCRFVIDFNRRWISPLVLHKWQAEEKLRLNGLKLYCLCLFFFASEEVLMSLTWFHYRKGNS